MCAQWNAMLKLRDAHLRLPNATYVQNWLEGESESESMCDCRVWRNWKHFRNFQATPCTMCEGITQYSHLKEPGLCLCACVILHRSIYKLIIEKLIRNFIIMIMHCTTFWPKRTSTRYVTNYNHANKQHTKWTPSGPKHRMTHDYNYKISN